MVHVLRHADRSTRITTRQWTIEVCIGDDRQAATELRRSRRTAHRLHALCQYFGTFPPAYARDAIAASSHHGVVLDPFCGRGTTILEALLTGREAAGCDTNPVAACVAGAKADPPDCAAALRRLHELQRDAAEPDDAGWHGGNLEFFKAAYQPETLAAVRRLRRRLEWRTRGDDRFIAAVCLSVLHGESHRSPRMLSNRMPGTLSPNPEYLRNGGATTGCNRRTGTCTRSSRRRLDTGWCTRRRQSPAR